MTSKMTREEYRRYLSSAWWLSRRQIALARAGNRCEFREDMDCYFPDGEGCGPRCEETQSLEVHHLTYDRLGAEQDRDLKVLCELHHLLAELRKVCCHACSEPILDREDALRLIQCVHPDDRCLDAVLDALTWDERFTYSSDDRYRKIFFCLACSHFLQKDD